MRRVLVITIFSVMAAAFGSAQSAIATDARTASGGLPPVYDQTTQPTCSGGGPPGADEILYDSGRLANAFLFYDKTIRYAVRMDPAYHPAIIAQCDIHVLTNGDPYWPWPDSHHDSICVEIWLDSNGDGMPDLQETWGQWAQATGADTATITVRPPLGSIICRTGSFWVGMMEDTLAASGYEGIGIDSVYGDNPDRYYSYAPPDTSWGHGEDVYVGDLMFRSWTYAQSSGLITVSILAPSDSVLEGDAVIPRVVMFNAGSLTFNGWVWMRIRPADSTAGYVDSDWAHVPAYTEDTASFRLWVAGSPGLYPMQCTADSNDTVWPDTITVFPGGGLEEGRLPQNLGRNGIEVGPNPIRSGAAIRYCVLGRSRVRLRILDARGIVVRTLVSGYTAPGEHLAVWDSRDDLGRPAPRGIYFVRLESQDCQETRKVILAR
jgi:hypothetical protein